MGVVAVLENVPRGSRVKVIVNDATLVNAFHSPRGPFIKSNGKPCAGEEFWRTLLDLIHDKDIDLSLELAKADDVDMAQLTAATSNAAAEKLAEMDPAEALKNALPPKPRRGKRGGFPSLEDHPVHHQAQDLKRA